MQSRVEDILQAMIDGTESSELPKPQSRNEDLLLQVLDKMNEGGGGGAVIDDTTVSTEKTWSSSKIDSTKLDANQGGANSGKVMGVDATGDVVPVEVEGGNIAVTETPVSGEDYAIDIVEGEHGSVTSVAGKTGVVTLNGDDVSYSDLVDYGDGTVGGEIADLKSQVAELDTIYPITVSSNTGSVELENAKAGDMKKCLVTFEAVQSGEGIPSPTNVRTISPVTGLTVTVTDERGQTSEDTEISFASVDAQYGGVLDAVTGLITCDVALFDLSQVTWSYQSSVRSFYANVSSFSPAIVEMASADADYYALCDTYRIMSYSAGPAGGTSNSIAQRNDATVKRIYVRTDGTDQTTPTGHILLKLATPITYQIDPAQITLYAGTNSATVTGGESISVTYTPDYASLFEKTDMLNAQNIDTQKMIAVRENGTTAAYHHKFGEFFCINDKLVYAVSGINIGDTLSETGNYQPMDVGIANSAMSLIRDGYAEITDLVQGKRNASAPLTIVSDSTRCTVAHAFIAYKGDSIEVSGITSGYKFALAASNGIDSGWKTTKYTYVAPVDLIGFVNIASSNGSDAITPSDVSITIKIEDRSSRIAASSGTAVKDYYASELADTVAKARANNNAPALVFLWTTDIHRYSSDAGGVQNFEAMIQNMKSFKTQVPCDFVLNTGDLTDGAATQAVTLQRSYDCLQDFMSLDLPYYWAHGNHDTNYAYSGHPYLFTMAECYQANFTGTKNVVYNYNEHGTDYYTDFIGLNVRMIVLNANNVDKALEYAYGDTTAAWLTDALDTDKKVLLIVHQSPIKTQVYSQVTTVNAAGVVSAIEAFIANGGDLIMLSGHSHNDVAFVSPWLSIMDDCQRFSNTPTDITDDAHSMTGYIDVVKKNARVADTASEDLWSVCVYKPDANDLDIIRFGAGTDRYYHATPIAPTTVTTKLTGTVTWSSSDTSVATVSAGAITGVATGRCAVLAKDVIGNYECWIVDVA